MRILMISVHTCPLEQPGTRYAGGMNIYVRNLALCLSKHYNIPVDIFTRSHSGRHKKISRFGKRIRIIHIPLNKNPNLPINEMVSYLPRFSEKIMAFIQESNKHYTLINSHYYLSGIVAKSLKETLKIPHVTTFHTLSKIKRLFGDDEPKIRTINEQIVINRVDHIIATTHFEKRKLIKLYQTDEKKISVIPGGVDITLFRAKNQIASREKLKLPKNKHLVLFVGRLDPIKGLKTLIRSVPYVIEELCKEECNVRFLVVGGKLTAEDKLSKELRAEIKNKEIAEHIKFIGSKPAKLMPYFYSASDLTVIPSNYESFGLVALEAMACKSPVLASRVASLTFLIENKKTGVFFKRGDEQDLAKKIVMVTQNEDIRKTLVKNGHSFAKEHHWCIVTDEILNVFSKIIKNYE